MGPLDSINQLLGALILYVSHIHRKVMEPMMPSSETYLNIILLIGAADLRETR